MKNIHFLAFIEIDTEQDEYDRRKQYDKLKQ
jgi:hypothetical protein